MNPYRKIESLLKQLRKSGWKFSFKNPPIDPVCGMAASDSISLRHQGKDYFFCSDHCKEQFEKNPELYL